METHGVPVLGYKTKELPAFYTQKSDFEVDYQLNTAKEIANFLKAKWDMNLKGGVVISNPIPTKFQLDYQSINKIINEAVLESKEKRVVGKEITPFLLAKVKELTDGKSLEANIQLVYNNAKLAAQIAAHII